MDTHKTLLNEQEKWKNIIIPDQERLAETIRQIRDAGPDKFHVLADFDSTLTRARVDGHQTPSLISVLRDGNYLTTDYAGKAQALFDTYHPIERDPDVPLEEKKAKMKEWWTRHFDLLIQSGLARQDLEKIVASGKVRFRDGISEFVEYLQDKNIPLVIMSASGLGADMITMLFEQSKLKLVNVHIISNSYEWDKNGHAIGIKEPIIHVFNKDETAIQDYPVFNTIRNRKNVLLLGDSMGDLGMVEGFEADNVLKVGFLNEEADTRLTQFQEAYNVTALNDTDLSYVNALLKRCFEK